MPKATIRFLTFLLSLVGLSAFGQSQRDSLLQVLDNAQGEHRVLVLNKVAATYLNEKDYASAEPYLLQAEQNFTVDTDLVLQSKVLNNVAILNNAKGRLSTSLTYYFKVKENYERLGEDSLLAESIFNLGLAYKKADMNDSALLYLTDALQRLEQVNSRKRLASAHNALGNINRHLGNYAAAEKELKKGLELRQQLNLSVSIARSHHSLGQLYFERSDYAQARSSFAQALEMKIAANDTINIASTQSMLGEVELAEGNMAESRRLFTEALRRRSAADDVLGVSADLRKIGKWHTANGDPDSTRYYLALASDLIDTVTNLSERVEIVEAYVGLERSVGNYEAALVWSDSLRSLEQALSGEAAQKSNAFYRQQFETAKKEKIAVEAQASERIAQEEKESERRQKELVAWSALALLITLIFAISQWRKNLKKRREIADKNQQLEENVQVIKILHHEVKHRTKNNLQALNGILRTSLNNAVDRETKKVLQDTLRRIQAMTLVHRELSATGELGNEIQLKQYLKELLEEIRLNYNQGNQDKLNIDIEDSTVDFDIAIYVGLIVNELVTNAFKYGRSVDGSADLAVDVKSLNQRLQIRVADTGVGLSGKPKEGTGLTLVRGLVRTLKGEINFSSTATGGLVEVEIQKERGNSI